MKLSVIPSDSLIIVDGTAVVTPDIADKDFSAIHWDGTVGRIERMEAQGLVEEFFYDDSVIQPYLTLWAEVKGQVAEPDKDVEYRYYRNQLLAECDWTQLGDNNLTEEQRAEWAQYREALRNVPQQAEYPEHVVWPEKPATS